MDLLGDNIDLVALFGVSVSFYALFKNRQNSIEIERFNADLKESAEIRKQFREKELLVIEEFMSAYTSFSSVLFSPLLLNVKDNFIEKLQEHEDSLITHSQKLQFQYNRLIMYVENEQIVDIYSEICQRHLSVMAYLIYELRSSQSAGDYTSIEGFNSKHASTISEYMPDDRKRNHKAISLVRHHISQFKPLKDLTESN